MTNMEAHQLVFLFLVCCFAAKAYQLDEGKQHHYASPQVMRGCTPGENAPGVLPFGDEENLPVLPDFFTTHIMWNIQQSIEPSEMPAGLPGDAGWSVEVRESFDGVNNRRALRMRMGMISVENDSITMEQTLIYNKGENDVIELVKADGKTACQVDSVSNNAILQYLIGYNASNPGHVPSVMEMLHFGSEFGYQFVGIDESRNIPCKKWKACVPFPFYEANMKMYYWWSDPSKWTPALGPGKTVPIRAEISGVGKFLGKDIIIYHSLDFQDFQDKDPPPGENFQLPSDFYCEGRTASIQPLKLTNYFSYKAELFAYFPLPAPGGQHIGLITNQQVFYDYFWKVSRLDYKPIDYNSLIFGSPSETGQITEIHEFSNGLTYRIDNVLGNCTVENISWMDEDADVVTLIDGKVIMANPMAYFDLDSKYYFNGKYDERGLKADVYIAKKKKGLMHLAIVWYLSADGYLFEEDQLIQKKQPMKLVIYPVDKYDDPLFRTEMNIYNFNQEEPNLHLYDISPCYDFNHKKNYIFTLPGNKDWKVYFHMAEFQHEVIASITSHTLVSPLRINRVAIDNQGSEIYVLFTLLDVPPISGDYEFPTGMMSLKEASKRLEDAINNNQMVVRVPVQKDDKTKKIKYVYAVALKSSLKEIERYDKAYRLADTGYTGGDMAGMAIGMLLFGLLIATGIYFIVLRKTLGENKSVFPRSFENPISISSHEEASAKCAIDSTTLSL